MRKREVFFFIFALFYFIFGLIGSTAVSQSIAQYIGKNGWSTYNQWTIAVGSLLTGMILTLLILRAWLRRPTWWEWLFFFVGLSFSLKILYFRSVVLLSTELVHLPQFMILTLLFLYAFPRQIYIAVTFSVIACIADEWVQSFLPSRVLDINDIFLNFIGLFLGLILYWALSSKRILAHFKPIMSAGSFCLFY